MKTLLILSLFIAMSAFAQKEKSEVATEKYTDDLCRDYRLIAQEFIDLELSGQRWQGSDETPVCLTKQKPKTMGVERLPAGDVAFLDPIFLLPEGRRVDFTVKHTEDDFLEVNLSYIAKTRSGKDKAVKDSFVLKLNFGKVRNLRGCASMYSEPEYFVMRSKCWKE